MESIKHSQITRLGLILVMLLLVNILLSVALPVGPVVVSTSNETAVAKSAALLNTSGGSITTLKLNATSQNQRWKAYVGNITGILTLDDANNHTIFDWTLSNVMGEIYATRSPASLQWTNMNCSNLTHISNEEIAINHTSNPDDNITITFNSQIHNSFFVGTRQIPSNNCYSIHTYINDTNQISSFEEVILYDGTNSTDGQIVYTSLLEQDKIGFDGSSYDFQMIVPEKGLSTWAGSTAYYFYVELT